MKYEKQHGNLAVNLFKIVHKSGIFLPLLRMCAFYFVIFILWLNYGILKFENKPYFNNTVFFFLENPQRFSF